MCTNQPQLSDHVGIGTYHDKQFGWNRCSSTASLVQYGLHNVIMYKLLGHGFEPWPGQTKDFKNGSLPTTFLPDARYLKNREGKLNTWSYQWMTPYRTVAFTAFGRRVA